MPSFNSTSQHISNSSGLQLGEPSSTNDNFSAPLSSAVGAFELDPQDMRARLTQRCDGDGCHKEVVRGEIFQKIEECNHKLCSSCFQKIDKIDMEGPSENGKLGVLCPVDNCGYYDLVSAFKEHTISSSISTDEETSQPIPATPINLPTIDSSSLSAVKANSTSIPSDKLIPLDSAIALFKRTYSKKSDLASKRTGQGLMDRLAAKAYALTFLESISSIGTLENRTALNSGVDLQVALLGRSADKDVLQSGLNGNGTSRLQTAVVFANKLPLLALDLGNSGSLSLITDKGVRQLGYYSSGEITDVNLPVVDLLNAYANDDRKTAVVTPAPLSQLNATYDLPATSLIVERPDSEFETETDFDQAKSISRKIQSTEAAGQSIKNNHIKILNTFYDLCKIPEDERPDTDFILENFEQIHQAVTSTFARSSTF